MLKGLHQEAVKIEGMKAVANAFKNVGGAPLQKVLKETGKNAGEIVARVAREEAPVGPDANGHLRDTIRVASLRYRVEIRAGNSRMPYANPIHWGWFYDKKNLIYKNIKPNPFLARALGYTKEQVFEKYTRDVDKLLENEFQAAKLKAKAGLE